MARRKKRNTMQENTEDLPISLPSDDHKPVEAPKAQAKTEYVVITSKMGVSYAIPQDSYKRNKVAMAKDGFYEETDLKKARDFMAKTFTKLS